MKTRLLYLTTLFLLGVITTKAQVFFSQDFNSQTLATLQDTPLGTSKFDKIAATGTADVIATGTQLVLDRSAGGTGVAYAVRKTDLAPATQLIKLSFKLNPTGIANSGNSQLQIAIGQDFKDDEDVETANAWERIGINHVTDGKFQIRDATGTTANGTAYNGGSEYTLTFYFNATSETQKYSHSGNSGLTLAPGKWNAFVGNDKQFANDRDAAVAAKVIKNFKFRLGASTASYYFDDITLEALPLDPLPVSLTSFTGKWENGAAQLKWQTASEQNNSHFDILRSADGINFVKIATKEGQGTTSQISNYNFTDNAALAGINYYKLLQVDFDGKSKAYDAITIKNPLQYKFISTIVTASGDLLVKLNAVQAKSSALSITNIQGRKIATHSVTLQEGNNHLLLPFAQASAGVYILSVDGVQPQKFLKK